ncbi:MAG: hypothetical protein PF445_04175 [Melioribacteraceae bacterium]|jgi:hypothetical protein|nr:hypothetical protein [Melioribacteraceae bacterium]
MNDKFEEPIFREIDKKSNLTSGNVIKSEKVAISGKTKITIEEESHEGVKFIIKKDSNDEIKEIKFICSCGQTKSLMLDYSEE